MIEFAKLIHTALHSDSTLHVVLAMALVGASIFGFVGFLVNAAYLSGLPNIQMEMTSLNAALPGPPYVDQGLLIVLQANVSNSGSQSAVKDWSLHVDFPDGKTIEGIPIPTDPQLELTGDYRLFRGQDALYKKTINPIQPGQIVPGFLAFLLKGKAKEIINDPNVAFRLVAIDAYGKPHTAIKTRGQFKNELHFPLIPVSPTETITDPSQSLPPTSPDTAHRNPAP